MPVIFIDSQLSAQIVAAGAQCTIEMADDGMLVNFSIGDEVLRSKPVFKGGRWRDRLSAKRSTQRPHTKATTTADGAGDVKEVNGADTAVSRPAKRQRIDDTGAPSTSNASPPTLDSAAAQSSTSRPLTRQKPTSTPRNAPKEVISSLFSYNPSSANPHASEAESTMDPIPSNAALTDPLSTFTSLGLSASLSSHLLTKFSLSAPTAIQATAVKQLLCDDSDAFIQAETGSGKTLGYLLPIVQRIMALSPSAAQASQQSSDQAPQGEKCIEAEKIHRTSGLFCIILAPTRELSTQISRVLSLLLHRAPYIVSGTVIGGEKKKSEKARLRKGLNILVATPGRLADHLSNTEVLDVSQVRWLVLDEGDRLMELGFEEEIRGIVEKLEERVGRWVKQPEEKIERNGILKKRVTMTKTAGALGQSQIIDPEREGLPRRRVTVLCSATMKMTVQRLGEISLKDAVHIKADPKPFPSNGTLNGETTTQEPNEEAAFQAPAQLKQAYIVVPAKQRLVTLTALLKHSFARRGNIMKAIVFLSCADNVDFHFSVFARPTSPSSTTPADTPDPDPNSTTSPSPTLSPHVQIHRLHGSLPQHLRTSTLRAFTHASTPSILLCTDVASRGLDLPNIDLVIEYDPAFSADDHLHRIGRTARAGKQGRAESFLMPGPEEGYVSLLQEGVAGAGGRVTRRDASEVLRKGFLDGGENSGGETKKANWEDAATEWQLETERWVIEDRRAGEMARKAFVSHVRAYATHVVKERGMFDVKALHLGHLAKAFALRERPGEFGRGGVGRGGGRGGKKSLGQARHGEKSNVGAEADGNARKAGGEAETVVDGKEAARKMRAKMREHMAAAGEFNIG